MKARIGFIAVLLFCWHAMLLAQTDLVEVSAKLPDHPRLLLLKGEEKVLKKKIQKDAVWKDIHQAILDEANAIIDQPANERIKIGRRLLGISRDNLKRIFFLSYAFRMSGEKKYAVRAEQEMLKAASFSDWNPSHFLDVGEMTMAMAIGYDWLYPQLGAQSKSIIEQAIIEKGLTPSLESRYNWFVDAIHNWNQVCHAGMAYGALAVWKQEPELASTILNRAIGKIAIPMKHYAPDGAYPEGVGYWEYGTSFNVMFLSAVEKIFGSDFGLSQSPGFLKTGEYVLNMVTPQLKNFCYSDNGANAFLTSTLFWFYDKTKDPSILYNQALLYKQNGRNKIKGNRLAPAMLIWGASASLSNPVKPSSLFYVGKGDSPVCSMRSDWEDPEAIYVGVKLGSPSVNHAHMDIGSFVFEADGVDWGIDMGGEEYNSLETKGVELWGSQQDAQRWDVFRYNNFAHNTLSFNQKLQTAKGNAVIGQYSDQPDNMYVSSDLTPVYAGQVKTAKRTVSLKEKKYVVVEDQIETVKHFTKMTWSMATPASATVLSDRVMLLEKDGKKLYIKVESDTPVRWSVTPAKSAFSYDSDNPGISLIRFDTDLKVNDKQTIRVSLYPSSAYPKEAADNIVATNYRFADTQLRLALDRTDKVRAALGKTPEELPSPRNIQPDGSLRLVHPKDWCSGFFPGELWYMYEYTQDSFWKEKAMAYTTLLEPLKSYTGTHDLGFMLYCSYGNGYRLNPSDEYKEVLLEGAKSLASRFSPLIGCIRSWNHSGDKWQYPVIIDNMMNLEFLFWATRTSGDSTYYKIAVTHADNTMKNHFRKDYSSYHVIDYDPSTGAVRNKHTHQGYAHESAWARGQAWGLYGYTMCYRETGDKKYLEQAEHIASFIFSHPNLPADLIPYWDFNAPDIPAAPRDVSAATIAASALYELATFSANGKQYKAWADRILDNLTKSYVVPSGGMHGFLLRASTGHKPGGTEINVPIIYADYYYLEALNRKKKMEQL